MFKIYDIDYNMLDNIKMVLISIIPRPLRLLMKRLVNEI
jgi:hypothetical protein